MVSQDYQKRFYQKLSKTDSTILFTEDCNFNCGILTIFSSAWLENRLCEFSTLYNSSEFKQNFAITLQHLLTCQIFVKVKHSSIALESGLQLQCVVYMLPCCPESVFMIFKCELFFFYLVVKMCNSYWLQDIKNFKTPSADIIL